MREIREGNYRRSNIYLLLRKPVSLFSGSSKVSKEEKTYSETGFAAAAEDLPVLKASGNVSNDLPSKLTKMFFLNLF